MAKYRIEVVGSMPMLMHCDVLTDPLHPLTKEMKQVSRKRVKTDEDHELMSWLEFRASLYVSPLTGEIVIPSGNLMKCLIEGARQTKSGAKVERGVTMLGIEFPLEYHGPRTAEELFAEAKYVDRRSVKVSTARVMRTRPIFREWSLSAEAYADPSVCSKDDLTDIVTNAGRFIGLGDNRKGGYGRFSATVTVI